MVELSAAPEDRCQRSCQVVAISREHPQCWECVVEAFTVHLPELDRVVEVTHSKPAERPQGQVSWELGAVGGVCRYDDLAAVSGVHHPRSLMHGVRHIVAFVRNRDPRVHTHPDTQR